MDDKEIIGRLDLIIRLLAMNQMKGKGTKKEKTIELSKLGFKPKEIASILNTTSNTVNVTLTGARKEGLI